MPPPLVACGFGFDCACCVNKYGGEEATAPPFRFAKPAAFVDGSSTAITPQQLAALQSYHEHKLPLRDVHRTTTELRRACAETRVLFAVPVLLWVCERCMLADDDRAEANVEQVKLACVLLARVVPRASPLLVELLPDVEGALALDRDRRVQPTVTNPTALPAELWALVAEHVDSVADVLRLARTCRFLRYQVASSAQVWRQVC